MADNLRTLTPLYEPDRTFTYRTSVDGRHEPVDVELTTDQIIVSYDETLGELGLRTYDNMGSAEVEYLPYSVTFDGTTIALCLDGDPFVTLTVDQARRLAELHDTLGDIRRQLAALSDGLPVTLIVDATTGGDLETCWGAADVDHGLDDIAAAARHASLLSAAHTRITAQVADLAATYRQLDPPERDDVVLDAHDGNLRLVATERRVLA